MAGKEAVSTGLSNEQDDGLLKAIQNPKYKDRLH